MFIDFIVNHSLISIPVTAYIVYAVLDLIVAGLRKTGINIKSVNIKRKILYLILTFLGLVFGVGIIEVIVAGTPVFFGYFIVSIIFGFIPIAYVLLLFIITLAIYEKIKKINSKFQIIFLLICILLFIPRLEFSNLEVLKCQFSLSSQQINSINIGSPLLGTLMPMNSIGIKNSKTICSHKVALDTQNPDLCKDSDCFFDLAIKTKNALLCEKVTKAHSTDMEDCYIKIAQSTKNSSLCENIRSLGWRKMCYERLGIAFSPMSEKYFITCDSCSDCTTKISNASPGTVVQLDSDLYYKDDKEEHCIELTEVENVIFDCQSHKIVSQTGKGIGIKISNAGLNTIKNCMIANFDTGTQINADNAHYNHLLDNIIEENNRYGISIICKWLHPPENILKRNIVCNNFDQDIFVTCREKIINKSDKYDICGIEGSLNTCDKTPNCKSPYSDTGKEKGCTYKCDKVEN